MTYRENLWSISRVQSPHEWEFALEEAEKYGICGLNLHLSGNDPLSHEIKLVYLSLPDNRVYLADCRDLVRDIITDLVVLLEEKRIRKVLHNAKSAIAFVRSSQNRKIDACNLFDLMLASQVCWSGYYYLEPPESKRNPWKKRIPDHSLSSLAERHLGIILDSNESAAKGSTVLLPLYDILAELISKNDLHRVAELEFQAISSIVEMEITGIQMDCSLAEETVDREENEICDLVWCIQEEAKKRGFVTVSHDGKKLRYYLNPNRQEDVVAFLRKRGFSVPNTRAEILRGLAAAGCAFAEEVLRYRHASYLLAFLNNWLFYVHSKDGRIHSQYMQIRSPTGRVSCRKPNAQQIPRVGEGAIA